MAINTESLLKWTAHAVIIAATLTTAFDITPANKVLFVMGCVLWAWVGFIWRQPSLWSLNIFCCIVYLIGIFR
jgi:hypothetical protein